MCIFSGVSVGLVDLDYTVGENSGMVEVCLDLSGPIAIRVDITLSVVEDTAQCKEENIFGPHSLLHVYVYTLLVLLAIYQFLHLFTSPQSAVIIPCNSLECNLTQ